MKRERGYLIVCMLFFCACFSQNDTVYWAGKVRDKSSGLPVKNALILLKLSNGGMYEAFSNDSGYYSIKLRTIFEKGELSVSSDRNTLVANSKPCNFIASQEKHYFTFPEAKQILYNFTLNRAPACLLSHMPEIWFGVNSTKMLPYSHPDHSLPDMRPEEVIEFYYQLLTANPEIVVEIKGRCDYPEKHEDRLSEKRARLVAGKLIAKGIPTARIVVKGAGIPLATRVRENDLAPKTEEQKQLVRQKNRSAGIRIISWDYIDPKTPVPEKNISGEH